MRSISQALFALATVCAAGAASATPLITNGGFDGGTAGWTATGSCSTPAYNSGAVILNDCGYNNSDPSIGQNVTGLVIGDTYLLSWSERLDSNYSGAGGNKSFGVFLGPDAGTLLFANEYLNSVWKTFSATFTATSTSQLITFAAELDPRTAGVSRVTDVSYALDNVSLTDVSPVPEPGSLALLGLGLAGLAARRYRYKRG